MTASLAVITESLAATSAASERTLARTNGVDFETVPRGSVAYRTCENRCTGHLLIICESKVILPYSQKIKRGGGKQFATGRDSSRQLRQFATGRLTVRSPPLSSGSGGEIFLICF